MIRQMMRRVAVGGLSILLLLGAGGDVEMAVPVEIQVPILLKVLTFDRHLTGARRRELVFVVLFQGELRASALVKDQVTEALSRHAADAPAGRALKVVALDADREEDLAAALGRLGAEVLYVAPVRALDVAMVAAAARRVGALSLTGVPSYVASGLSIGLGLKEDRPRILINLEAARAEGADFAAPLLELATIVSSRGGGS